MNASRSNQQVITNNTVIGSVPLRAISDSSSAAPKQPAGSGGQSSSSDSFRVSAIISVLFSKLPANLRDHVAFRHFYTDELDAGAHSLCIKYFTLFVLYFSTVFRLEGRRRHFLEHPTERSGREFSAAHKRARTVFHELSAAYSAILMRYNRHSEITYTARHALLVKGRTNGKSYTGGFKNLNQMLECKDTAFKFESEDFLFYEHLSAFALQIVKMAFAEDPNMQEKAASQVSEMFRSRSFTFNPQRRRMEVRNLERQLDSDSISLKENTAQIAELLTPHDPRIIVKYANQQRTPFVQTKFPGGTSFMKYQRPKPVGVLKAEPTRIEKQYTIEAEHANFPMDHPAMYRIRLWKAKQRERSRAAAEMRQVTGLTPEPTATAATAAVPTSIFSASVGRNSSTVNGGYGRATPLPSATAPVSGMNTRPSSASGGIPTAPRTQTPSGTNQRNSSSAAPPPLSPSASRSNMNTARGAGGLNTSGAHHHLPPLRAQSDANILAQNDSDLASTTQMANNNHNNVVQHQQQHGVSFTGVVHIGTTASNQSASQADSLYAFEAMIAANANVPPSARGDVFGTSMGVGGNTPFNATMGSDGDNDGLGPGTPTSLLGGTLNMSTTMREKGTSKSESDRLELEEREAKFYEIFSMPRLFSTHAATTGVGMAGHSAAAINGAAAVYYHAVEAAAAASSSKAPPPLPFQLTEPTGPLTTRDFKAALATVIEAWDHYDLTAEIDAVYQAVANGVVVKDLALPSDIMLCYDDLGVLYVSEKDGTPLTQS